jgi:hypothetical protein
MADIMERLRTDTQQLATPVRSIGWWQNAGERLGAACGKTQAFASRMLDGAGRIKRDKPIQFLTVLAGAALAAGFAVRLWRSSTNA